MKRGEWLKARREELKRIDGARPSKFSVRSLAARIGITGAGLSNLESSDAMPTIDIAVGLARELGMPVEWVLTGVGEELSKIPITGDTVNGPFINLLWTDAATASHGFVDLPCGNRKLYGLKITSAMNGYRYGDVIICDTEAELSVGEDVAIRLNNPNDSGESFFIRTLSSIKDGCYTLDDLSSKADRSIINRDELQFIHQVVCTAKSVLVRSA
jgi:transcriptional regulator with XRE-family HTH domain